MATDREPRDPHQPVDFVPVRIGGPHRALDPLAIGALVVAVGLLAAIVKPWGDDPVSSPSQAIADASSAASGPIAGSPLPTAVPFLMEPDAASTAVALLAALQPRDAWGVRIVVPESAALGRGAPLTERWRERSSGATDRSIRFQVDGPILALGLTTPADRAPLAIRIWKLQTDGSWSWIDAPRPNSDRPAADLLLLPPRVDDIGFGSWPSGRYRLDALMGATIERLEVSIDTPAWPAFEPDRVAVDPGEGLTWPGILASGPFAVVEGRLELLEGRPLTDPAEAASWLDIDRDVAVVASSAVAGLGVALPPGSTDVTGTIQRLAPSALRGESAVVPGAVSVRLDAVARPVVTIRFDPPDGLPMPSGVYALAVRWQEADAPQSATWVVEVRPASDGRATSLLDAAYRYASHAGSGTLVFSGGGRRQRDAALAPVRALPLDDSIGCDADIIDETPAVLGFALADGDAIESIRARLSAPLGRTLTVPLRLARDVVPGLSLVAPIRGVALAAGIYHFTLQTTTGTRSVTVCLGTSPFSG